MVEFKLVISDPKKGRSVQKEAKDEAARRFLGAKIGDSIKGEIIDLAGYEFVITGGSDDSGFPMRRDIEGTSKRGILSTSTVGLKIKGKGARRRKTVAGNTISSKTSQINMKITKYGKAVLFEEKKEEKPAEAPKEEAKPESPKAKEKKEEVKETPKEEKKVEEKPKKEIKPEVKEEPKKEQKAEKEKPKKNEPS